MDLLARVLGGELLASTPGPTADFWYLPVGASLTTEAGMRVDEAGAQKLSAWYRGKDLLSTSLAMLPLHVFERLPNNAGADVARQQPLYDILHRKPNPWQDSFQWRRQAMRHLIDYGSAYNRIVAGPRGFVDELHPIHPSLVTPEQMPSGRVLYRIRDPKTGTTSTATQDQIFRLMGASEDGITSMGVLEYARQSLGTAMATESYAAHVFGKGTLSSGVITVPTKLDPDASKRMAASFITASGDWRLPKVLEQGASWAANEMSPEDFQMLLSRKFSVDDVARWLGLPPHMLGSLDRATFSNIEQQSQEFVTYSLGPWLSLWEFAINDQLILNVARFFAEFNRDALVRGDLATRWTAHVAAVNAGIKTVDEVRDVENLNLRGGVADELRQPQNITGKPAASEPAPAPPARRTAAPVPPDGDEAQAQAIVVESAARCVRKECKVVLKLAVQHAGDEDAFAAAVTEFYTAHVALLVESLLMPEAAAASYCAGQARQVLAHGVSVTEYWHALTHAKGLAAWALEGKA
jgi:HK97 family phage portal protein